MTDSENQASPQTTTKGLEPVVGGGHYWHRQANGSFVLKSRWSHKPVTELPAGSHRHKRAIAVLDLIVPRLTPEQRKLFDRLADASEHGLDPHTYITLVPMIERGLTFEQLAKYVGAKTKVTE